MHWFSLGAALLAGLGIIGIGLGYLTRPMTMARTSGRRRRRVARRRSMASPQGTRDVAAGVLVPAFKAAGGHRALDLVLLVLAISPLGDISTVLGAKGRTATAAAAAVEDHGLTAARMILAFVPC